MANKKQFSLFFGFGLNYFNIFNCFAILSLSITIVVIVIGFNMGSTINRNRCCKLTGKNRSWVKLTLALKVAF